VAQILIADNDKQVNDLLCALLRMEGWEVDSVFDGAEALEYLREHVVRLLVCDLDMPRMDGFGLVGALGELSEPPEVLVVTGFTDPVVRDQLAAGGAVRDVWIKPFDLEAFCGVVREVMEPAAPSMPAGEHERGEGA